MLNIQAFKWGVICSWILFKRWLKESKHKPGHPNTKIGCCIIQSYCLCFVLTWRCQENIWRALIFFKFARRVYPVPGQKPWKNMNCNSHMFASAQTLEWPVSCYYSSDNLLNRNIIQMIPLWKAQMFRNWILKWFLGWHHQGTNSTRYRASGSLWRTLYYKD